MTAWLLVRQVRADGRGMCHQQMRGGCQTGTVLSLSKLSFPECWFSFSANGAERIQKKIDEQLSLKKKMSFFKGGSPAFSGSCCFLLWLIFCIKNLGNCPLSECNTWVPRFQKFALGHWLLRCPQPVFAK